MSKYHFKKGTYNYHHFCSFMKSTMNFTNSVMNSKTRTSSSSRSGSHHSGGGSSGGGSCGGSGSSW